MIVILEGIVLGNSGKGDYSAFKPWHHASGVERWIIDESSPTHELEGYSIRLRSQTELEIDPRYISWAKEQQLDTAQIQATVDFSSLPTWMRTYTREQARAYIETNITNLATAKTAIEHLADMVIVLRDFVRAHGI